MNNLKLSIIAALAITTASSATASSFNEALTNGKVSGEVTATYENRDFDKENKGTYYQNTAYGVGSFALKYETAVWNDFSVTSKFRAYRTLYEEDDSATTNTGKGDASERFYDQDETDIENMFLQYNNEFLTITAGRQAIRTDWINRLHDAIKIDGNFGDTSVEAIWSLRQGRVFAREYFPMTKINEGKGVYKLGLTQKINDTISATAYALVMPDVKDIYGGKVNLNFEDTAVRAHYAISQEDLIEDSSIIDLKVSTSVAGFNPFIGYIKVDSDAGFSGFTPYSTGEMMVPFEEGDYVYSKDAQTLYVGVSKSFADLSATLQYGHIKYDSDSVNSLNMNETSLWLGYPVTEHLNADLGYTYVDEDSGVFINLCQPSSNS